MTDIITAPPIKKEVKLKHRFVSRMGPTTYYLQSGKACHFRNGEYLTDIQSEITELNREIELGHPVITTEEGKEQVNVNAVSFLETAKEKAAQDAVEAFKAQLVAEGKLKPEDLVRRVGPVDSISDTGGRTGVPGIGTTAGQNSTATESTSPAAAPVNSGATGTTGVGSSASLASLATMSKK